MSKSRRKKKKKNQKLLQRKREKRWVKNKARLPRDNKEAINATQRARIREARAAEQATAGILATSILATGIMAQKGDKARQAGKIIQAENGNLILPGAKRQP